MVWCVIVQGVVWCVWRAIRWYGVHVRAHVVVQLCWQATRRLGAFTTIYHTTPYHISDIIPRHAMPFHITGMSNSSVPYLGCPATPTRARGTATLALALLDLPVHRDASNTHGE